MSRIPKNETAHTIEDVHETERRPLYVARTRARDHLLVPDVEPASEFARAEGTRGDGRHDRTVAPTSWQLRSNTIERRMR